jgi:hypothetical protein
MPREFRVPFLIAWLATITSVLLAIGPNYSGRYDPTVAVLTATLVSLVWYTYFTFQLVNRRPPIRLSVDLSMDPSVGGLILRPIVSNPNETPLHIEMTVEVWIGGVELTLDEFFRGRDRVLLMPGDNVSPAIPVEGEKLGGSDSILVRMHAWWHDDHGNSAPPTVKHWCLSASRQTLIPVLGERAIGLVFDPLKLPSSLSLPRKSA